MDIESLIAQSVPFCQYGENYNRHIHVSSANLRSAIDRGHTGGIIESLSTELKLRLDHWGGKSKPN